MSITYSFYIREKVRCEVVVSLMASEGWESIGGVQVKSGARAFVHDKNISASLVESEYCFTPAIGITFQFGKFGNYSAQKDSVLSLIEFFMKKIDGEVVFVINSEYVILFRDAAGVISVNENYKDWYESRGQSRMALT